MERRQWRWFYLAAVAVVAVKEDLPPFLMGVGAYLFFRGERRRGSLVFAGSLIAFIVIVGFVIPAASDAGRYGYRDAYAEVLRRPWAIPVTLVNSPTKVMTAFLWIAPFATLPLASPLGVLLVPFAIERFLSSSPNHWGTLFHYSAPVAPIMAMAAADGLARLNLRISDVRVRSRTAATLTAACVILAALLPGHQPLWAVLAPASYRFGALERAGGVALQLLPAHASVVAQTNVAAHLSHRVFLYRLDPEAPDADYVIAVAGRSPWPLARFQDVRNLLEERRRGGYRVVFDESGWIVLQRATTVSDSLLGSVVQQRRERFP
jgi:uncharacterized membrane protein